MSQTYKISHYQSIVRVQKSHFWFRARNRLLLSLINRFVPAARRRDRSFLEIGFGTGIVLHALEGLGMQLTGIDVNAQAVDYARKATNAELLRSSIASFKTDKRFDAIGTFDVLEHQQKDREFIVSCGKLLKPNGLLFLTVPALPSLWSEIDTLSGHKRRYTKVSIESLLSNSGFHIVFWNYWQLTTLPMYLLWRFLWSVRGKKSISTYLAPVPPVLNAVFFSLLYLEEKVLTHIHLPVGTSLVVCAVQNT